MSLTSFARAALLLPLVAFTTLPVYARPRPQQTQHTQAVTSQLPAASATLPAASSVAPAASANLPAAGASTVGGPATSAAAATPDPNEIKITGLGGNSAQWTIVVLLTLLTILPSLLICMTPFARILIVFHFLRQALGLQTTPSNQTLIGLSVILTFFLMQPVAENIYHTSVEPMQAGKITAMDAVVAAGGPMKRFMGRYVKDKDVAMFTDLAHEPRPANPDAVSFRVLLPAYIVSELKAGFQIGAVLFLPFLVIDMVVASITTSMGMMQLPPVVISTPLKIILFLMVNGWDLLIGALIRSFN